MTAEPPLSFDDDAIERAFGRLAGPIHVPSLTSRERESFVREQLSPWVRLLVRRFALDTRVVPPCWTRHPGMVEALAALRDHERACFTETAAPSAALDWFRGLREIEARLMDLGAATRCSTNQHRENPAARWADNA
ncbi:hypothetical protein [Pedococcus sp. 5OH_020]|uniref:hypothetical protein n=1 Tax=Pedococcus sp. 5OH_020 TaxID=2989814 RepID=UPI0022E9ED53|nr:hypothetical protein [Pedococcus sp. 5OH_020]